MFVKKKYNGRLVAKKQTGCLLSVVTITCLMLVRLEYLAVGWSALAKQLPSLSRMKISLPSTPPRIFVSGFRMYRIARC